MAAYSLNLEPPECWDEHCSSCNALFHSRAWQALLEEAFPCQTVYGWNPDAFTGMALTNFRAGPFRIGYLGFPVGGLIGSDVLDVQVLSSWKKSDNPIAPHCLRIPVSGFSAPVNLPLPFKSNPETAIINLQDWNLDSVSKKLRRDIRKVQRSGMTISDATLSMEGDVIYRIYRDTVKRHSGSLRYNEAYFSALIALAQNHPGLRCLLAWYDRDIAGFLVAGQHLETTYYLHGGTSVAHRAHSPSDLLLHEAITWGQKQGSDCFNLMTSSADQPTLILYKEKWGGITRQHRTYMVPLKSSYCSAYRIMESLYSIVR
jgi:hypothetical protein